MKEMAMNMYINFEKKIEELLTGMTLREKLGQLTQAETAVAADAEKLKERVRKGEVGSILMSVGATAGNTPQGEINIDFYNELQRVAVEESRTGIPLLFGRDVIHGHRTVYPIPLAMACSFNDELIQKCYSEIAEEAANDSVHWTFAPMLDLARDSRWGRIIEGCGEDPYVGSQMAKAVVNGLQGDCVADNNRLLACAKHFVGYGAAEGGRDYTHTEISDYSLYNYYLPQFRAAIDAGVATVMSSFNDINGEPVTASKKYLSEILRGYLNFQGMVVSDYAAVAQLIRNGVAKDRAEATELALNAGVDMDMWDFCYIDEGEKAVSDGRVSMETIDCAVRNVLRVKLLKNLFEKPYCIRKEIDYDAHRKSARRLATESMVLLKNQDQILPLNKNQKILLVGQGAVERRNLHGSWALDGKENETPTLLEAMDCLLGKNLKYDMNCESRDTDADVVVIALCEHRYHSGENACVSHISISEYEKYLIKKAKTLGKKTVGIFFYGRPIATSGVMEDFDAVLYAWHSGSEAATAATDLLFGAAVPSGKLVTTMPCLATHLPLYYNAYSSGHEVNSYYGEYSPGCYTDSPASPGFPFGYGLSYTFFQYGKIGCTQDRLSVADLMENRKFQFLIDIENTGNYDASEIVQLYIHDPVAKISRPLRELKAFQKCFIEKGKTKTILFELGYNDLGYYDSCGKYRVEPGDVEVYIGENCLTERRAIISIVS